MSTTLPQHVQDKLAQLPEDDPLRQLRQRKSKIAIVGFTEHRQQALDLDPDEWALYGLNELYRYMPLDRFDLWCEIHDWDGLAQETDDEVPPPWPRHVEVLSRGFDGHPATKGGFSVPVYMQQRRPDVAKSHALPKQWIEDDLADTGMRGKLGQYKTSAPAWMLGQCIAAGFEEIHLYGIDMATLTEYAEQRSCMEFLMGVAAGRGIKVSVPDTSDLLHSVGQYAFGGGDVFTKKLIEREGWLNDQLQQHQSLRQQIEKAYQEKRDELNEMHRVEVARVEGKTHEIIGQLQNLQYMKRSWAVPVSDAKGPHPDRTKDPRTGIGPGDALGAQKGDGVADVAPPSRGPSGVSTSPEFRPQLQPMTATPAQEQDAN